MTEPTSVPLFMQDDLPTAEPKLDPKTILLGTEVMVVIPSYMRRVPARHILTKVIKRGRVWITVETAELTARLQTWDLRLDTQHDGKDSNYRVYFYTLEQHQYREARNSALEFLREQGLSVGDSSQWRKRTIQLARILWEVSQDES